MAAFHIGTLNGLDPFLHLVLFLLGHVQIPPVKRPVLIIKATESLSDQYLNSRRTKMMVGSDTSGALPKI